MSKIDNNNFLVYNLPDENIKIDVFIKDEDIWVTQKTMSELFGIDRTGISRHLKNIFSEGELEEDMVCANFAHTTEHGAIQGKTQVQTSKYYNLDAIISVGYRVNSNKATKFRIWATSVLKEYMQKLRSLKMSKIDEKVIINYKLTTAGSSYIGGDFCYE